MLAIANEQLLRRDDPHREMGELTIYRTDHGCEFWDRIKFLSDDASFFEWDGGHRFLVSSEGKL